MKKKIIHPYICEGCGKPATINIQSVWKKYRIEPDGDFTEEDEWDGDTNEFVCDNCGTDYA